MKNITLPFTGGILILICSNSYAGTMPTGVYSGEFGDGKATLFIDSVTNGKVQGSSLYKHNKRPISGTIKPEGNFWRITLREPATQIGDGRFDIMANKNNPEVLIGTWKVFNQTNTGKGIAPKSFTLDKAQCGSDKYAGTFSSASNRILTDEDLYTDPDTLDYMRNEIYARHGYSFKTAQWASTFAEFDWYVPCYTDVNNKLTSIEKENIKNIKTMHAYMVANPNQWGR